MEMTCRPATPDCTPIRIDEYLLAAPPSIFDRHGSVGNVAYRTPSQPVRHGPNAAAVPLSAPVLHPSCSPSVIAIPIRLRLVFKSMQIGTIQVPLRCSLPPELLTLSQPFTC